MSAESPRRGPPAPATHICHNVQLSGGDGSNASTNNVVRCVPAVVPPQPVNDRTIIDSVTGFISDVTLQTAAPLTDAKDTVLWARFEPCADISDLNFGPDWDLEGGVAPPLLLILGYGNGVQVWVIPANGEASEVLSWRHGNVRVLRILPTPMWQTHGQLADEPMDQFSVQRPLMAVCDNSSQYYAVNFVSLRDGSMCRSIKFKSPILDILANRYSIVVTFQERIAVFDARNFEDRLTVTTCHPSPGINPNPVALGSRWLAYAEQKLMTSKRSNGGCDCDGVTSYTATVLNAAKSLGKGLRELGEQVAAGLSGTSPGSGSSHSLSGHSGSSGNSNQGRTATKEPGVITILDIKHAIKEVSPTTGAPVTSSGVDPMVAHFVAHSDAVVALAFDPSGMLLLTADKRGHDFHVFRIFPHPGGAAQAAAHHLYVLHRGDTTSKVQDIAFSLDSRWVSISTLRGTTHVFPVTPYGGPAGVRTHGSPHVVNRLSRFHRSAGLSIDGRSSSPLSHSFDYTCNQQTTAYSNPRVAPFPHPTVVLPLAQVRQPSSLSSTQTSAGQRAGAAPSSRQRLSSASDDAAKPMRVCAAFGRARSWLLEPREQHSIRWQKKPVDALFIVASHGALIQYDLEPRHTINIPKEKVSDDTPIELDVVPKAQWNLLRKSSSAMEGDCGFMDIQPPLPKENWLLKDRCFIDESGANEFERTKDERDDRWLSQVEIITHAGPHRRLWMGPQFTFKTYNTPSGAPLAHIDSEAVEIGIGGTGIGASSRPARSNPMNMPHSAVPVLIESGSCSSHEQSPRLMDQYRHEHMDSDFSLGPGESQLREDLADAMRETPGGCQSRDHTGVTGGAVQIASPITPCSALASSSTSASSASNRAASASSLASSFCKDAATATATQTPRAVIVSIAKVVNPLGTVTTVTHTSPPQRPRFDDNPVDNCSDIGEQLIHENCDESLFRPVVAVYSTPAEMDDTRARSPREIMEEERPPEPIGLELIVPVMCGNEFNSKRTTAVKKEASTFDRYSKVILKSNDKIVDIKKDESDKVVAVEKNVTKKTDELVETTKEKKKNTTSKEVPKIVKSNLDNDSVKIDEKKAIKDNDSLKPASRKNSLKESGKVTIEKIKETDKKEVSKSVNKREDTKENKKLSKKESSKNVLSSGSLKELAASKLKELPKIKEVVKSDVIENVAKNDSDSDTFFETVSKEMTPPPFEIEQSNISNEFVKPLRKEFKDDINKPVPIPEPSPPRETEEYPALMDEKPKAKKRDKDKLMKKEEPIKFAPETISRKEKKLSETTERYTPPSTTSSSSQETENTFKSFEPLPLPDDYFASLEASQLEEARELTPPESNMVGMSEKIIPISTTTFVSEIKESTSVANESKKKKRKNKQNTPPPVSPIKLAAINPNDPMNITEATFAQKLESDAMWVQDYNQEIIMKFAEEFERNIMEASDTEVRGEFNMNEYMNLQEELQEIKEKEHQDMSCVVPLAPLEPFELSFDQFPDMSLINFESPLQEKKLNPPVDSVASKYTEDNIIFAMCSSLREEDNVGNGSKIQSTEYKGLELEIDENYLSLDPKQCNNETEVTSSDDTEDSSQDKSSSKMIKHEDEELQPLIQRDGGGSSSVLSGEGGGIDSSSANETAVDLAKATILMDSPSLPIYEQQTNNHVEQKKDQQQKSKKKSRMKRR